VDVTIGAEAVRLPGLRRKTVLAVLGLHLGETVSTDRLTDIVWGSEPPATAPNVLQGHMSFLRGVLGGREVIVARQAGYLLDLPAHAADVAQAERLVAEAGQRDDPGERAELLRAALGLWRGHSLSDVCGVAWLDEQATRLERLRLRAIGELNEARLALGEHAQLVPELQWLTDEHPFDEPLHGQLMVALYRSGRQADALAVIQALRRTIGAELGAEPGPELRELEVAILRQDPALDAPKAQAPAGPEPAVSTDEPAAPVPPPTWTAGITPAQLPFATAAFAGRRAELAELAATARTARTVVVSGEAGVGKSALAVHWAHRVGSQFTSGQLYAHLRGSSLDGSTVDPAEAVLGFLVAFGFPPDRLPATLPARVELYRSTLAHRSVLIVLDDAADEEQVRPLLPDAPGCLVVVTSRHPLSGLDGRRLVQLTPASTKDAREMLIRRLGVQRTRAEPEAVERIIARCAGLPSAIALAAAFAAIYPHRTLASLAEQLRDADALDPYPGSEVFAMPGLEPAYASISP
jgi:DNA-binding SARP family transcriptional activator